MKKLLIFLPLLLFFFCTARPAHAQTKYYIGGCIGETASSATVNCSPSPGIPAGSAVAIYVRWDNNSGSLSSLVDVGGNSYTTLSTRVATTGGGVQTTVLLYTCFTTFATGQFTATLSGSQTKVDIEVVGYRNVKDNACLITNNGLTDTAPSGSFNEEPSSNSYQQLAVAFIAAGADNTSINWTAANSNAGTSGGAALEQSNHQLAVADDIIDSVGGAGVLFTSSASTRANTDIIIFTIQACKAGAGASFTGTISCTMEVRPNQLVIVGAFWYNTTATVSDTKGLTYISAVDQTGWGVGSARHASIIYAETGANSGADTLTLTFGSGSTFWPIMYASANDNLLTSSPLDVTGSATGTGTSLSTGNFTTTAGNDLIFTFAVTDVAPATFTNGSGYAYLEGLDNTAGSGEISGAETKSAGAAGSYAGTYTLSTSQTYGIVSAAFFSGQVATPTFSPVGATYSSPQTVTISDATSGATIYYTTDGSTPTAGSTVYTVPLTVSASETIKAFATAAGLTDSAVGTAVYVILTLIPRHLLINR